MRDGRGALAADAKRARTGIRQAVSGICRKKCALTLSKVEILSLTERILTETSEQAVEAILAEYRREPEEPAAAAPASIAAESASPAGETAPPIPAAAGPPALTAETVPPAVPPPPGREMETPAAASPEETEEGSGSPPERKADLSREKQRKKKKSLFGDLLFYGVLVALIVGVVILTGGGEQGPRSFAGFTMQTVLTSSMESVIPKDSLVISRYTDPNTLEIGDDITFMTNETTTITHRIIGIVEDYADTGQRAFQTQGVMNAAPDSQLVPAVNVVGKVVFHSYAAGKAVDFLENYWPLLLFFLVILAVLTRVLKYIYRQEGRGDDSALDPDQKKKRREKSRLSAKPTIQMQGGQP